MSPITTPPPLPPVSLPPASASDSAPAQQQHQPAAPFPSRTTSRPTFTRKATYDSILPTPPPNDEPFAGAEPEPAPAPAPPQAGPSGAKPAWDALRRKVLPTAAQKASIKAWPIMNPNDHSELVYHGHHTSSSGRATPTFATASTSAYGSTGGRATPTRGRTFDEFGLPGSAGLARMVGAATGRKKKSKRAEPSVQQRFAAELLQVDALFRSPDESSTSGAGLAAAAAGFPNGGVGPSARKRSNSDANRLAIAAEVGHKADPVQALRLLESILERYRPVGTLPDATAVLAMLARPFLSASRNTAGTREMDKYDEALCDMALGVFERFCEGFSPADGEEELERWRWMLAGLEVTSDDLRTRISRMITLEISPTVHPSHWNHLTSSITLHSLLASLVHALHFLTLRPTPSTAAVHALTIRTMIDRLATGQLFTASPAHFALSLSLAASSFETLDQAKLCRLIVFDGLLLIAVGAAPGLLEWLVADGGSDLLTRYWTDDGGGLMRGRLLSLFAKACHLLLSAPPPSTAPRRRSSDIFAPSENNNNPHTDAIKPALLRILSTNYPSTEITSLSPTLRGRLVYAHLAFFSSLTSTAYQLHDWPPPISGTGMTKEVHQAKLWVAEAWRVDKASAVEAVRQAVRELISLEAVAGVVGVCTLGMDPAICEGMAAAVVPTLFERITAEPSAAQSRSLLALLRLLAARHPPIFFKPLFTLSSSPSKTAIRTALSIVLTLTTLLGPSFYLLRDPEMMVVALLADPGAVKAQEAEASPPANAEQEGWAPVRLGQLALLLEMVLVVRDIRTNENTAKLEWESAVRFADGFEPRFAIFLAQRERTKMMSFSQRTLITMLLFEIRMLSKPTSRPHWLGRVLAWAGSSRYGHVAQFEAGKNGALPSPNGATVTQPVVTEPLDSFRSLQSLYEDATKVLTEPDAFKRRSMRASVLSPGSKPKGGPAEELNAAAQKRLALRTKTLLETKLDPLEPTFKLCVAVHAALREAELERVLPVAWEALSGAEKGLVEPAAYLVMLCGEKIPAALDAQLSADIASSSPAVRRTVPTRLATIFSLRFSLLSQSSADRSRRRPLKVARQQLNFVPLEVGSDDFVPVEPVEEASINHSISSMPPEVRRALLELGWDDRTEEQALTERQRRPLSLLPCADLGADGGAGSGFEPGSPSRSPQRNSLIHRQGSTGSDSKLGGYLGSGKAKAVITLSLARSLLRLTELVKDDDVAVASSARSALFAFLRDEPVLVLSPILVQLSSSVQHQRQAINQVRQLLSLQTSLPPGVTHRLFNHIGGLIKTISREPRASSDLLRLMAFALPSAAALAPLVSDFSLRDLRKNKVEPIFLSGGGFWFSGDHPSVMALPHTPSLRGDHVFRTLRVDETVFRVAMVRVAQMNLQGGYVAKAPREAYAVKKGWSRLELPGLAKGEVLEPFDFRSTPEEKDGARLKAGQNAGDKAISALVARAWLISLMPVLSGLSRNFNARDELAVMFEGVTKVLLVHGQDVNILGLALRLCMMASTRFRRLFSSSNGFGLFVPALFKVFVDGRDNPAIRASILYAFQRFYRAHEESFVFQALGALSPCFDAPGLDDATERRLAGDLFALVETLQMPSIDVADIAGIRGANEREERDALIHQVNDRPDVFLSPFTAVRNEAKENARLASAIGQAKPFSIESAIKLFLTVIAFDPTSARAREFLSVFHHLVPSFYSASDSAKALLGEGIAALANVFAKPPGGKSRTLLRDTSLASGTPTKEKADPFADPDTGETTEAATWLGMRRIYLLVVEAYHACGGELSGAGMKKVLEIVRFTMRGDPTAASTKACGSTLATYTLSVLGPGARPTTGQVLAFLNEMAPLVRLYLGQVDFTTLFDSLARIRMDPLLSKDEPLAELVTKRILSPALEGCAAAGPQGTAGPGGRFLSSQLALVRLFAIWTTHPLTDALAELERQPASPAFLASFVFPLALQLASPPSGGGHAQREMEGVEGRERRRLCLLRVVGYAMRATESGREGGVVGGGKEREERDKRRRVARRALGVQVVKVCVVAAEEELTKTAGAWLKLSAFFRSLLAPAGSSFLHTYSSRQEPPTEFPGLSNPWAPQSHHPPPTPPPPAPLSVSVLDRTAWSTFHLLALYPSPLLFHLRLFVREKLVGCRLSAGAGRMPRKESLASLERRRGSSIFAISLLGGGSRAGSVSTEGGAGGGRRGSHARVGSLDPSGLPVGGLGFRRDRSASADTSADGKLSLPNSPNLSGSRRRSSASVGPGGRRRGSATPFQPSLAVFAQDYLPIAAAGASSPSLSVGSGGAGGPAGFGRRGSVVPGSSLGPISAPVALVRPPAGGLGLSASRDGQVPTLASTRAAGSGSGGWGGALVQRQELAEEVVKAVYVVQVVFGETPVELRGLGEEGSEVEAEVGRMLRSWTKAEGLRRLREEMGELVGEFADVWGGGGGGEAGEE